MVPPVPHCHSSPHRVIYLIEPKSQAVEVDLDEDTALVLRCGARKSKIASRQKKKERETQRRRARGETGLKKSWEAPHLPLPRP